MKRRSFIAFALIVSACGGGTDQSISTATSLPSEVETVTTTVLVTTTVPVTTTMPAAPSDGGASGEGFFPFNSTDPAIRECLVEIFGQALYVELNTRPPSPSEGAAMGPCMAPSGAEGSGPGGSIYQPDSGSTVDCDLGTPSLPTLGWVIENEGVLDYRVLGHSPGRNIGGASDCLLYTSPSPRDRG